MAATFPCPHCGATYPVKPVLIGKVVRCTACKQPFKLREDGTAEKVSVAPVAAAPVAAAPVVAASVTAPAASAPQTSQRLIPRPSSELTRIQEDARRAMSANLTSVIGRMKDPTPPVVSEPAGKPGSERKQQTPGESSGDPAAKNKTDSIRKSSSRFAKVASGGKKPKGPVALTNQGEREAAIARAWKLGFFALVVVLSGLIWLITLDSSRQQALHAFTATVDGQANRYGYRLQAIQTRAWVPTVTPFVDLGSSSFGSVSTLAGSTVGPALSQLKGLVRHPTLPWWVAPERLDWLTATAAKVNVKSGDQLAKLIAKAGMAAVPDTIVSKSLAETGVTEDAVAALMALLTAPSTAKSANPWPERLIAGTDLQWCLVSGRQGTYLTDPGQNYVPRTAAYQGVLIHFQETWKLALLRPVR